MDEDGNMNYIKLQAFCEHSGFFIIINKMFIIIHILHKLLKYSCSVLNYDSVNIMGQFAFTVIFTLDLELMVSLLWGSCYLYTHMIFLYSHNHCWQLKSTESYSGGWVIYGLFLNSLPVETCNKTPTITKYSDSELTQNYWDQELHNKCRKVCSEFGLGQCFPEKIGLATRHNLYKLTFIASQSDFCWRNWMLHWNTRLEIDGKFIKPLRHLMACYIQF